MPRYVDIEKLVDQLNKPSDSDGLAVSGYCNGWNDAIKYVLSLSPANPEVNWPEVPVNTHVWVRHSEFSQWVPRRLAMYLPYAERKFLAFCYSASHRQAIGVDQWRYCKLADDET